MDITTDRCGAQYAGDSSKIHSDLDRGDQMIPMGSTCWYLSDIKRFWFGYLEQAFLDLNRESRRDPKTPNGQQIQAGVKRNRNIVKQWFFTFPSDQIGSLAYVCEVLGYDIDYVRELAHKVIRGQIDGKRQRVIKSHRVDRRPEQRDTQRDTQRLAA